MAALLKEVVVREKTINDVDRIIEIVKSLLEWFTPTAVEEVERDTKRLPGFVAEVGGIVRGFILLEEQEYCVEIA